MSPVQDLMKGLGSIAGLFTNTLFQMVIIGILMLGGFGLFLWFTLKPDKKILYVTGDESWGEELTIQRITPAHVYTKMKKGNAYRFIRYRAPIMFQVGMKTVTRFFGLKGTAYTRTLEEGEAGPYTLLDIMTSVWSEKIIDELEDDIKQKLIMSQVPITVRLQTHATPEGMKPRSELWLKKEANDEMARVFGENIRREMNAEDWVRTLGLVGAGVGLALVAQAIGIIGGFAQ